MLFNNERKCDACKKNVATVHYKQNVNGHRSETYLCSECAAEKGWGAENLFTWDPFEGFDKMLGGFFAPRTLTSASCPTCGRTLSDVKRSGRFGCSDCYEAFGDSLDLSPFASGAYRGRRPLKAAEKKAEQSEKKTKETKEQNELDGLKEQLKAAVKNEEYEKAAGLRDRIRALESGEGK